MLHRLRKVTTFSGHGLPGERSSPGGAPWGAGEFWEALLRGGLSLLLATPGSSEAGDAAFQWVLRSSGGAQLL